MMVLKRKQIIVLSLVLMIIIAGYLQYSYKKSGETTDLDARKGELGEAVYVDLDEESIPVSDNVENFFASAKLDREITRSRETDNLREIAEDSNASEEIKAEAFGKMLKISENTEKEMRIENLIKEKGYEDVLAFFADDGSVDILVRVKGLTAAQVAQIADIVNRHAGVEIKDIHIRTIY